MGALIGIGGGLIIRPCLAIMDVSKNLATFSSAVTVLAMSIANIVTHHRRGTDLKLSGTLYLAFGSIVGGFLGGGILNYVSTAIVNTGYIFVLILVLISVFGRPFLPSMTVHNPIVQFAIGLVTGSLSGFFGIGGGPFQMVALILFFNLNCKDAAVQSIVITMLTTISSVIRYSMDGYIDFSLAVYMIPAAILGGILGSIINRKMTDKTITRIFCMTVMLMIGLQVMKVAGLI